MRAGSDEDAIVDINVTPLVDVTLVLLIIFLATSYMIAQQSLKVQLPKATQTVATEARTIAVVVKETGEIVLDGQAVEPAALVGALQAKKPAKGNLQVVVGADRNVMHGRVVEVMDAVRQAGITDLAFAVERP